MSYRIVKSSAFVRGNAAVHYPVGALVELTAEEAAPLLVVGRVEPVGESAPDEPVADVVPGVLPSKADPKHAWVEYAVSVGVKRDVAEELTKPGLIEAVERLVATKDDD